MTWWASLPPDRQEALFAVMREMGEAQNRAWATALRLAPPYGTIGLGSADFDYVLEGQVIGKFLGSLRGGSDPEKAHAEAKAEGVLTVQRWNLRGSMSRITFGARANLHRDAKAGDPIADRWLARIRAAVPK